MSRLEVWKHRTKFVATIFGVAWILGFALISVYLFFLFWVVPGGWVLVGEPNPTVLALETVWAIIGVCTVIYLTFFGALWAALKRQARRARL